MGFWSNAKNLRKLDEPPKKYTDSDYRELHRKISEGGWNHVPADLAWGYLHWLKVDASYVLDLEDKVKKLEKRIQTLEGYLAYQMAFALPEVHKDEEGCVKYVFTTHTLEEKNVVFKDIGEL